MRKKPRGGYKRRMPRDIVAEAGEPVWGNGCELRGCLKASHGVFIMCSDGIAREFCEEHSNRTKEDTHA